MSNRGFNNKKMGARCTDTWGEDVSAYADVMHDGDIVISFLSSHYEDVLINDGRGEDVITQVYPEFDLKAIIDDLIDYNIPGNMEINDESKTPLEDYVYEALVDLIAHIGKRLTKVKPDDCMKYVEEEE